MDEPEESGKTPLMVSCREGYLDVIDVFIEHGA
jgi:ankyrin repeat protein